MEPRRPAPLVLSFDLSFRSGKESDPYGVCPLGQLEPERQPEAEARRQAFRLARSHAWAMRQPLELLAFPPPQQILLGVRSKEWLLPEVVMIGVIQWGQSFSASLEMPGLHNQAGLVPT